MWMNIRTTVTYERVILTPMHDRDPYTPTGSYYECLDCQYRTRGADHLANCPECGGTVRNLAVARE